MTYCVGSVDSGTPVDQTGGGGATPTPTLVGKAWQRLVRERRAADESDTNLFGKPWEHADLALDRATVRPVNRETAKSIIEKYEWMGCLPAVVWESYGIFFDGFCGGVVCYGPEYSENLGAISRASGKAGADWSKYGYEGKMILLSRGACAHWTPPNSGSKLIRTSMRLLAPRFEVVTATVDPAAGEIGTIYQACGFTYVGSMREGNPNVVYRPKDRHGWMVKGKLIGPRAMRAIVGSTRDAEIRKVFPDVEIVMQHSKGRYFAFRGHNQAAHRHAIAHLIKPFPKRGVL